MLDPDTMQPVPADGETIGEIMFRGNITMKGYLKNPAGDRRRRSRAAGSIRATSRSLHPDGYIKVKDRAKDIIISGGENISSLEVEDALYRHPAVFAAAVVARPDREVGRDAVRVRRAQAGRGGDRSRADRALPRALAHFKAPESVVFGPLPKTATGKIQKFVLRERARSAAAIE